MFIAGISEFFLLAALAIALSCTPTKTFSLIFSGYILSISIIGFTAILGALRYLELADTLYWHQQFVYLSKHIAMPLFIIAALWPSLRSKKTQCAALLILMVSVVSSVSNVYFLFSFVSDATLMLGISLGIYTFRHQQTKLLQLLMALALLLSTLVWSALINEANFRIGIFHICLGLYFALISHALHLKPLKA